MKPIGCKNPVVARLFTEADGQRLTTSDLAKMTARHPNTILNWRSGRAPMSLIDAYILAGALGFEFKLQPIGAL